MVVSIIPKGCTQYLQLLDTLIFSVFKNHYQAAAEEYVDLHGSRSKINLSAKDKRILCTRLTAIAWARTKNSVDFERAFFDIGYTWLDDSPITIRTLPGFVFDPSKVTSSMVIDDEQEENDDKRTANDEYNDLRVLKVINNNKTKQLSLDYFFKK